MITVREFIKRLEEIKDKDSVVTIGRAKSKSIDKWTILHIDEAKYDYDLVTLEDYSKISIIFSDDNTKIDGGKNDNSNRLDRST